MEAFYQTVATFCFTLLGLWWGVLQLRHDDWVNDPARRRMAYSVHLAFVIPGLKPSERKWIWMVIPVATVFFVGGVAFAYFVMLPAALPFLLDFRGITTSPRPSNYFSFVLNLMFWVGVCFEMPLVVFVLWIPLSFSATTPSALPIFTYRWLLFVGWSAVRRGSARS